MNRTAEPPENADLHKEDEQPAAGTLICEVVPDLPLPGAFSYKIATEHQNLIQPGIRVLIPFGARKITGYVVGVNAACGHEQLKTIIKPLDREPPLTEELLAFTKQAAEYYVCPWSTILKAALPTFKNIKELVYYAPTPQLLNEFPDGPLFQKASVKTRMLLELLAAGGRTSADRLQDVAGVKSVAGLLKALVKSAIVLEEKELTRPKTFVTEEDGFQAAQEPPTGLRLGGKARAVLEALLGQVQPIAWSELRSRFEVSRAQLQPLLKHGLIRPVRVPLRRDPTKAITGRSATPLALLPEQVSAFSAVNAALEDRSYRAFLLNGVTGSGKTEIYLQLIEGQVLKGRQAIVLVPEISMTPLMISRFKGRFPGLVAVFHSVLAPKDRDDQWRRIRNGELQIVIGPRSAVFAPCPNLGLIIVDEEHDGSYKQDNEPYYHGRDMAVLRCFLSKTVVVLGSATPSLESFQNAQTGKYQLLTLSKRVLDRPLPRLQVVDMSSAWRAPDTTKQESDGAGTSFSGELVAALRECLSRRKQAIVLLNRRGYSTVLCCKNCLETIQCPHCSVALVFHLQDAQLLCHHCGYTAPRPATCPNCNGQVINYLGTGVQKLELELNHILPEARVVRLDSDMVRKSGNYQRVIQDFEDGKFDILLGTQLVAKGHDFPNVALVGVIAADSMLSLPDFRTAEREYALLTQVAGRAGRGDEPGECLVQALFANHYSIQAVVANDPLLFYTHELDLRKRLRFPPFSSMALVKIKGINKHFTYEAAGAIRAELEQKSNPELRFTGPAPAPIFKRKDKYQWQILIRSSRRTLLNQLIRETKLQMQKLAKQQDALVVVDIDPYDLS